MLLTWNQRTTSFSFMKITLTNNAASNYTVDNFKVKKSFCFFKFPSFFNTIVKTCKLIPFFTIYSYSSLTSLNS